MTDMFQDLLPIAKAIDVTTLRHKILAGNMANLNTPGYIRNDVNFEDVLREKLGADYNAEKFLAAIQNIKPQVVIDNTGTLKPDGNNVDMEREIGQITRNRLLHNALTEILGAKLRQMEFILTRVS